MASAHNFPKYPVDLVFVIDCTQSMHGVIGNVKMIARNFYSQLNEMMEKEKKQIDSLRIRIVEFRDLGAEGREAIKASQFFELPNDSEQLVKHISSLTAEGGDDVEESALEALWIAMRSRWRTTAPGRRHVIVLFTDAPAHPLGKYVLPELQDSEVCPKDLNRLHEKWGQAADPGIMDRSAKRLVIFAPMVWPWSEIETWENTVMLESDAGEGCREYDIKQILEMIAGSV